MGRGLPSHGTKILISYWENRKSVEAKVTDVTIGQLVLEYKMESGGCHLMRYPTEPSRQRWATRFSALHGIAPSPRALIRSCLNTQRRQKRGG